MTGEIELIPGRVLGDTELVDNAKLNDLGRPVLRIKEGAVGTREMADGIITADKLSSDLTAQLGVADGSVTTAKIVDNAVTTAKIADANVTTGKIADSSVTAAKVADASLTAAKMAIPTIVAWVNFNGTGAPAINASFNVSSITDHGAGDYTINFTNALADGNYAVSGSALGSLCVISIAGTFNASPLTKTATACRIYTSSNGGVADFGDVSVIFIR